MARLHRSLANAIITKMQMIIASRKIKCVNKHRRTGLNLHKLDRWKYNGMKNKLHRLDRPGNKNVAHKDTFFKTPVHFGGGQEMEMLTGVKNCLWLECGDDKSGCSAVWYGYKMLLQCMY